MDNPYLAPRAQLGVPDAPSETPAATLAELSQTRLWVFVMISGSALAGVAQALLTIAVSGLAAWLSPSYLIFSVSSVVAVWLLVRVVTALGNAMEERSLDSIQHVIAAFTLAAIVGAGMEFVRNAASFVARAGFASSAAIAAFTSPPLATLTETMRRFRLALILSAAVSVLAMFGNYRIYTYGSWYMVLFGAAGLLVLGLEVWQIVNAGKFVHDPNAEQLALWARSTRIRCCVQGIVSVAGALGSMSSAFYWYKMH